MGKLLNLYTNLKKQDSNTMYLFKIGLFYNFLNEDAQKISNLLHLKITILSPDIIKCGFPANSLNKYLNLLSNSSYTIKVIDSINSDTIYSIEDFKLDSSIKEFLQKISSIDIGNISVSEAYSLLDNLKNEATKILK